MTFSTVVDFPGNFMWPQNALEMWKETSSWKFK